MRGVIGEQPRSCKLRERVGELERDTLEVGDPRAEGRALDRIVAREVEASRRGAAAAGRDEEPLDEEPLLRAGVPAAGHAVRLGNAAVLEEDLGMEIEVRVVEEARRLRDRHPRRAGRDDEDRLLAFGDREHEVEAGRPLARDEPLLAVEHPLVAVALRGGCDRGEV